MRREFALVTAVVLAACAGPRAPIPPDAGIDPPSSWRMQTDATGELSSTWWRSFGDPGLTAVVEIALIHNEDIRIAAARIDELASQAALAHAQQMPDVGGSVAYQRDRSINPGSGIPQVENITVPVIDFSYDADLFGRLKAASAAAGANLLAARAAEADVRITVAALTARNWFALRSLDERLDTLRQTLAARDTTLKLVKRRVSVGYAAQLDLAQAETEYDATAQQIPPTELAITRAEDALSVLLGESPRAIERSTEEPTLPAIPKALPSSLLRRRPDIVEAEERLVAADRGLDASRAAFMPDLRIEGDWGHVTTTILQNHPVDVFTLGASVLVPFFDAGRRKAAEDSAAARRDEAAWAYRRTALKAFAEVDDALASTERSREQLEALEAQQLAFERTVRIASQRYKAGYAPFLDQLDAQRGLLSVRLAISQVRAEQRNAYVTLFEALGGGWDAASLESARLPGRGREGPSLADR